jgi:hypothetical protein
MTGGVVRATPEARLMADLKGCRKLAAPKALGSVRLRGRNSEARTILTEPPHSQVAKDPKRGWTEALDGRRATLTPVADLLL